MLFRLSKKIDPEVNPESRVNQFRMISTIFVFGIHTIREEPTLDPPLDASIYINTSNPIFNKCKLGKKN